MKALITSLLFLFTCFTIAEAQVSGSITSNTQEPLIGSTVTLIHLPDSATAAAQMANVNGKFNFTNVKAGKYIVKASMLSFGNGYSASFAYAGQPLTLPALVLTT